MKFGFFTLGCKVNQYETQAMEQLAVEYGHTVVPFEDACDCYIINTCSVTAVADKKNRAVIRRCRKLNPTATIAVCGCYAQHDKAALEKLQVDVLGVVHVENSPFIFAFPLGEGISEVARLRLAVKLA